MAAPPDQRSYAMVSPRVPIGSSSARHGPINGGPLRQFNVGPGSAIKRHSGIAPDGRSSTDNRRSATGHPVLTGIRQVIIPRQ